MLWTLISKLYTLFCMALFQKKPITGTSTPLYTLGQQKIILIVGLGNIGKSYENSRHNLGFKVVEALCSTLGLSQWTEKKNLYSQLSSGIINGVRVILIKPMTLMNNSGQAVQATSHFYKIPLAQILVASDEIDIKFGQLRVVKGGSSAGHNGVQSVIDHLGNEFGRLRIGIGPKQPAQIDSAAFVLTSLSEDEQNQLPNLIRETNAIISEYIFSGGNLVAETRKFIV